MSEGRLTEAALQQALHPIALPTSGAGGWLADAFAVLGVALALALATSWLIETLFARRKKTAALPPDLSAQLAELHRLPEDRHRLHLYHLLHQAAPEAAQDLRPALYDLTMPFDTARIETMIRRAHD